MSSVLVARDGYGDMAVSNAIGSNVFDIDLGLGLPFVISSLIRNFEPVYVLTKKEQVSPTKYFFILRRRYSLNISQRHIYFLTKTADPQLIKHMLNYYKNIVLNHIVL